jgi:uncharacterized repeat protein (TIGR01451 family)
MTLRKLHVSGAMALIFVAMNFNFGQEDNDSRSPDRQRDRRPQEQRAVEASLTLPTSELLAIRAILPQEIRVGDSFEYHIQVANVSENVVLHNVTVAQQAPQGMRIESSEIVAAPQRSRDAAGTSGRQEQNDNARQQTPQQQDEQEQKDQEQGSPQQQDEPQGQSGQAGEWIIDRIGPGEAKTIVVTAAGDQEGDANICLTVTSYTPSLCIATQFVKPELEIVKQAPERATLCEEIEFAYFVKNQGTGSIEEFEIQDSLSPGLMTITGEHELRFQVDGLKTGETRKFVARLRAERPGEFASRAVASLPDGKQTRSARTTTLVEAAQLEVALEGPATQYVDRLMNYTIRISNTGDVPAPEAYLVLTIPESVRLARVSDPRRQTAATTSAQNQQDRGQAGQQPVPATRQSDDQPRAEQQDGRGSAAEEPRQDAARRVQRRDEAPESAISLGTIEPNQTIVIDFSTIGRTAGTVNYEATASYLCAAGEAADDEARVTAQAAAQTALIALPALAIAVVDSKDPVAVGDELTYTVAVKNEGEAPDQEVRVTAELAEGLEFIEASGTTQGSPEGRKITFEPVPELLPGEQAEWEIRAKVTKTTEAELRATLTSKNRTREATVEEPTQLFDDTQSAQRPLDDDAKQ